ncbi:hypothetical protein AvCA_07080 [Azotobacter vinelandii CA]|uniref:Uncharacterized protein n=2 Tax=Azotobacter vinelandii TaxID=354 RepID=C1DLL0_AZOVD|nr:hypothetical protein [Azotobacter vinelandii]ACO76958.1 conserved hypothetical protein [Azotobacter vinelandii DJ]AGK17215.1 hypothetical protein AvCA_07080 [Azotobacter vinelandii CA]AGK19462.1 hypothetical protein AvCA6_07080 [Azotobacter vinelandii CA6]SFX40542.1 hypothetical protein SAMN04244547_01439 [Azotobacter vinelandii]GLK59111.1 hypothetical protein GCM10017624_12680 [Azotobacter vinelandii]
MQEESFFEWLGETLGAVLRYLVETLGGLFGSIARAGGAFLEGLSRTLGTDPTLLGFVALAVGLLLLAGGIRALLRRAFVGGTISLLLGVWVLSWLIQ